MKEVLDEMFPDIFVDGLDLDDVIGEWIGDRHLRLWFQEVYMSFLIIVDLITRNPTYYQQFKCFKIH